MSKAIPAGSSFADFLSPVALGVSPALISPAAFGAMRDVARQLPVTLAYNTFGFECRMGDERAQADFSVQANPSGGRDSLAGFDPVNALSADLLSDPIWPRVQALAASWAAPASLLHHAVDALWMEFDLDGPSAMPARPSVFLGLPTYDEGSSAAGPAKTAGYRTLTDTATKQLTGQALSPRTREALARCFESLQRFEYVFQMGLMLARGVEGVRLCLRLNSTERTAEYLAQAGWAGGDQDLRGILELARLVDYTWLDIDVSETVQPKIGLECYFERNRQPRSEPRWETFLDALVRAGLCTVGKREALLAYPGYLDQHAPGVRWPAELRQASELVGGRSLSTFVRTLHHVKIAYRPGGTLEAKAYLAASHHWHTPG